MFLGGSLKQTMMGLYNAYHQKITKYSCFLIYDIVGKDKNVLSKKVH